MNLSGIKDWFKRKPTETPTEESTGVMTDMAPTQPIPLHSVIEQILYIINLIDTTDVKYNDLYNPDLLKLGLETHSFNCVVMMSNLGKIVEYLHTVDVVDIESISLPKLKVTIDIGSMTLAHFQYDGVSDHHVADAINYLKVNIPLIETKLVQLNADGYNLEFMSRYASMLEDILRYVITVHKL